MFYPMAQLWLTLFQAVVGEREGTDQGSVSMNGTPSIYPIIGGERRLKGLRFEAKNGALEKLNSLKLLSEMPV